MKAEKRRAAAMELRNKQASDLEAISVTSSTETDQGTVAEVDESGGSVSKAAGMLSHTVVHHLKGTSQVVINKAKSHMDHFDVDGDGKLDANELLTVVAAEVGKRANWIDTGFGLGFCIAYLIYLGVELFPLLNTI